MADLARGAQSDEDRGLVEPRRYAQVS